MMKKLLLLSLLLTGCNLLNPSPNTTKDGLDIKKYPFRIVDALPNPVGADERKEVVTIQNISSDTASSENWVIKSTSVTIRLNSVGNDGAIPQYDKNGRRTNPPKMYAPNGTNKYAYGLQWLDNDKDTLRLYAPDNTLVQTLVWANAKDGEIIKP
jgi:hypothetical protein